MIYISKTIDDAGVEWVSSTDYLEGRNDSDPKVGMMYMFIDMVCKVANYFNTNSTTAFGNLDLEGYRGWISGFCAAKGWYVKYTKDAIIVYTSISEKRRVLVVEQPKIPEWEIKNRKEIRELVDNLF